MTKILAVVALLSALLFVHPAVSQSQTCRIGQPLFQTTHEDPLAEVPLPTQGTVVLAGHSNAARVNPYLVPWFENRGLSTIDAGFGGKDSLAWANNNFEEYDMIHTRLVQRGLTEQNVTAWVWVAMQRKTSNGQTGANDPNLVNNYVSDMLKILPMLEARYPNLDTVWIASPQTSFSVETGNLGNQEPGPYRQGAASLRIADEYAGSLHIVPGPYMWFDPDCPRQDNLTATQAEYAQDGVHPKPPAAARYAQFMESFFLEAGTGTTTTTSQPTSSTTVCPS